MLDVDNGAEALTTGGNAALPVASVRYVADLPRKHRREKAA